MGEGPQPRRPALPAIDRFQSEGYQSIIPGYVVRDPSLPSLLGRLVYGDFFVDRPRSAVVGADGATDDREIGPQVDIPQLSGFGEDAGGASTPSRRSGPVYRLVETDTGIPCPASATPTVPIDPPGGTGGPIAPPGGRPPPRPPRRTTPT